MGTQEKTSALDVVAPPRPSLSNFKFGGLRELTMLPVIALIIVVGAMIHPAFLTWNNIANNILSVSSVLAILVVAESILLIAGKFDLSLQSQVALAPMISILLVVPVTSGGLGVGLAPLLGIAILIGVGLLLGAINGLLVAVLKLNAFIATLAMLILLQGITLGISRGRTVSDLPDEYTFIAFNRFLGMPLEIWIALAVIGIAAYFMKFHVIGREIYAIGGNVEAARAAGVKVEKVIFWLFVVAGGLSALAGLVLSSRIAAVSASQGSDLIFTVFAAAVVGGIDLNGGRGRIIGAATGVLLLGIIQNILVLSEVPSFWVTAIYGAVILVSMLISALSNRISEFLQVARSR